MHLRTGLNQPLQPDVTIIETQVKMSMRSVFLRAHAHERCNSLEYILYVYVMLEGD